MERRRASNWLTPPRSSARLTAMCQRSSPPITFVTRYSSTWKAFCVAIATSRPRQPPSLPSLYRPTKAQNTISPYSSALLGTAPSSVQFLVFIPVLRLAVQFSLSYVRAGTGGEDLSRIINSWNNGIESRRCAQPSHFNNAFCRFCYIASIPYTCVQCAWCECIEVSADGYGILRTHLFVEEITQKDELQEPIERARHCSSLSSTNETVAYIYSLHKWIHVYKYIAYSHAHI